jgi:hypothetical protein
MRGISAAKPDSFFSADDAAVAAEQAVGNVVRRFRCSTNNLENPEIEL